MKTLRKIGRTLFRCFAAVGFITVLVIVTPVVAWWAKTYAGSIEHPKGEVLILLSAAGDNQYGGISYSSYWRTRAALYAWQTGGFHQIVLCGFGDPGIANFLTAQGIPREVILTERRSTSTRENALETVQLLQKIPGKKVLLTSDFHIYRAQRVFRKLGIEAAPMAVPDVLHSTEHWDGRFSAFETMTSESVKIVYYKLRGWI